MPKKQKPDLTIIKLGNHLFEVTRKDGSSFLKWDWNQLLKEVQEATTLVNVTETKVKRTRKKKEV